jgi:site-specific DNA recombinase
MTAYDSLMRTWAGIIRISHLGTRRVGSDRLHSDSDQEKAIRGAVPPGHSLDLLPAEYDVSGGLALEQRPALYQAVRGVESGRYVGIIVAYHSRLFRNLSEEEAVYSRIERAGGEIILALEPIDNRTVDGRLLRRIRASMNVAERERQTELFDQRCAEATAAGIWQRRQTPLGYIKDPLSRRLVPSDDADKVRRAFSDRLAGKSIIAIAGDLQMTPGGARAVLRNRVYLGELRVRTYVNTNAHPAIVDEDLWHTVQHARVTRPAKTRPHPAMLASLARCAGCGHVMARTGAAYACARHHSDGPCSAPAAITSRILDDHAEQIALQALAEIRARTVSNDSHVKVLRSSLREAERELGAYLEAVQAAGLSVQTFAAGARKRQAEVDSARDALAIALAGRPARVEGDVAALWPQWNDTERNHVLCGLIEAVVVRKVGRGRVVPVVDRVRVIRHGAGLFVAYGGGGRSLPFVSVFPDLDDPVVLRMPAGEDPLDRSTR